MTKKKRKPGRPKNEHPTRVLKIACTPDEFERITDSYGTRVRAEKLLSGRMIEMRGEGETIIWRDIGAEAWKSSIKLPVSVFYWLYVEWEEITTLEAIINTGLAKRNSAGNVIVDLDLLTLACDAYCKSDNIYIIGGEITADAPEM